MTILPHPGTIDPRNLKYTLAILAFACAAVSAIPLNAHLTLSTLAVQAIVYMLYLPGSIPYRRRSLLAVAVSVAYLIAIGASGHVEIAPVGVLACSLALLFTHLAGIVFAIRVADSARLKEAEDTARQLQLILDNASIGISVTTVDSGGPSWQMANRAAEEMVGYGRGELVGLDPRTFTFSGKEAQSLYEDAGQAFRRGETFRTEIMYRKKDGSPVILNLVASRIDPKDPLKRAVWISEDITQQRGMEKALQRADAEQQLLMDHTPIGIAFIKNGVFQRCNQRCEILLDPPPGGLVGQDPRAIFLSTAEYDRAVAEGSAMLRSGETYDAEIQLRRGTGEPFWAHITWDAVVASDLLAGSILTIEDITERRRIQTELENAKSIAEHAATQLRLILDNASLGIFLERFAPEGRYFDRTNPAAESMLGFDPGELVGQEARILYSSEKEYCEMGDRLSAKLRSGVLREEVLFHRKNGSIGVFDYVASAIDPNDLEKGVVVLCDDITERKHIQNQLQRAQAAAEEARQEAVAANIAKSRFLAAASHDLRQPMHALDLYLGSVADSGLPEEARQVLGKARQCARTMDEMFGALLDMSKLDSGTVRLEVSVFPIQSVLDEVLLQFAPQASSKGLDLRVVRSSASVRSDPTMVSRILFNLISNAVRYTQRGKIVVGCRRIGPYLRLAVHDTGPGIPPDKQDAVFDEFFQLGNPERDRSQGLGLGLATVKRLSRLLSAQVVLASKPSVGSMFAIDLPLVKDLATKPKRKRSATSTGESNRALKGALIAVVDDELNVLDATRAVLTLWGCHVATGIDGQELLAKVIELGRPPDLLVCDYRLRGEETGVDVVLRIRDEFNSDVPALILTGDTAPERIREMDASGLTLLHKPVQLEQFRQVLLELISRGPDSLPRES